MNNTNNKKSLNILLIAAIISVITLILALLNLRDDEKHEELLIEVNKETKVVDIIDFTINPGDEIIYDIVSNAKEKINAKVEVWFTGVNSELEDVLSVYAKYNTYQTKQKSVTDCTSLNKLTFNVDLDKKNNYFELIFVMSEDVGNEYQNKEYDFDTYIKIIAEK